MIERLQRALEHVEELSPEARADLAQQIEDLTERINDLPIPEHPLYGDTLPQTVRDALALAGAWSDWQGDDEFVALDRIRHASPPTTPADEHLAWLDPQRP
jgi:hypothetical protein